MSRFHAAKGHDLPLKPCEKCEELLGGCWIVSSHMVNGTRFRLSGNIDDKKALLRDIEIYPPIGVYNRAEILNVTIHEPRDYGKAEHEGFVYMATMGLQRILTNRFGAGVIM